MFDNTIPERPPEQIEEPPRRSEPAEDPHRMKTGRQEMPPNTASADSDEVDIVDFQSMQSFPASDAPSWPAVSSGPKLDQAREQKESPETG